MPNDDDAPAIDLKESLVPSWAGAIGVIAFLGVAGYACTQSPFPDRTFGLIAAVLASTAAIIAAYTFVDSQRRDPRGQLVPAAILMNIVIFLCCLMLAVLAAADHWFVGILTGSFSLLAGGIIGILTAIPFAPEAANLAPAQIADPNAVNVDVPQDTGQGATVLVQVDPAQQGGQGRGPLPEPRAGEKKVQAVAAMHARQKQISVLGRAAERLNSVIGGAIAFNWKDVYGEWKHIAGYVGSSMMSDPNIKSPHQFAAYGGGLILAFGLLGVVSGLLLTRIFLLSYLEDGHDGK